ncbi:cellulase family glycosylhydrolase [Plebeiibacterium sediminum]|uniref:Cellulase family glycosylhydrolase n=1 Tax=Plebeiibacterium sediminum TaxID=2992112 RepID=A0AAE3M3V6_9BACT|nr:cellulase family glycosylhydrolase [Plebeiobacterium sediminum]MCW3786593.1 cellulase family glycosylhydrolase [Plebeiobacterium sediminum]
MKINHLISSFLIALLVLLSCSNESSKVEPELVVSTNELNIDKEGVIQSFYVKSNLDWTISSSGDWCSITPASGTAGTNKIELVVNENTTTEKRTAELTVTAGGINKIITINQDKTDLINISNGQYNIESSEQQISVQLETSDDFTVTIDVDWIVQNSLKALTDSTITFTVSENNSYLDRVGKISFTLNDITETAIVKQGGVDISIPEDKTGMESDAMTLASKMIVGWNIGNTMEVPTGETDWGNPMVNQQLIDGVKNAGFNAIRIPCAWNSYIVDEETYKISDEWLVRVKEVIDYCYNADMYIVLNIHWDGGWLENYPLYSYQEAVNEKQYALWSQIATYFRDYDEHLLFAGTNEVHEDGVYTTPTSENIEVQESYNQTFIDAVRATGGKNAYRNLVIQTYNTNIYWGYDYHTMSTDVVEDRLFVEVHYYDPYNFCLNTGSNAESTWEDDGQIDDAFSKVKSKYVDNGIPAILGEYGVVIRDNLSGEAFTQAETSRYNYYKKINQAAKQNGIITFAWDIGIRDNNGMKLFDRTNGEVTDVDIVEAIMSGVE